MKKSLFLILGILFFINSYGQLTGTKTIPGDYASVSAAIADLNSQGVGVGGVIINVAAGYTETLASATAGTITASGSASSPIVFQLDPSTSGANPLITSFVIGTAQTYDGMIKIAGGDYITFDGIDLQENPTNTTAAKYTDWGYALLKASATNGAQYNTIKNCSISLNKANTASIGIYGASAGTTGTSITPTSVTGINSYNKIDGCNISNVYIGISLNGNSTLAYYDNFNEIGTTTANTINYGGSSSTAYGVYGIYQNNFKINNNIIGSNSGQTSTTTAIFISTANNANTDINYNTINLTSASTTSETSGIKLSMGTTAGTSNIVNIKFNNVTINRTAATTGVTYFIYSTSNYPFILNIENNTIGGSGSSLSGTGAVHGISQSSSVVNSYIKNNLVQNITRTGTTSTSALYGIYNTASTTSCEISGNTVNNLYSNGSTGLVVGINSNATANIFKNNIYNLTSLTASGIVYGLNITSGTTTNVYNNFVSDLKAPNATGLNAVIGLNISGGTTVNAYYNTIYLDAVSSSASTFGTAGIYKSSVTLADLRNNIVVNNSTPGLSVASYTVAYKLSGTYNSAYYSSASNNNCFYAGNPSATNLIFFDGTNSDQTLADFKARVYPRENISVSELPPFINTTVSPYDLHLISGSLTQCESAATVISSILSDIDGDSRNNLTPDIGADEGSFGLLDLTSPSISFTALANTAYTTPRTLTATISDVSGIPGSAPGLPVLYWSVNSGPYNSETGVSIGNNEFTFTFGGGVIAGDIISYYIVAQDDLPTPNVGAYPNTGTSGLTANPPTSATPPTSPLSYTILPSMSGVYTIDNTTPTGGNNFQTFAEAVNALNIAGVIAPVTFNVYADQSWPITCAASPNNFGLKITNLTATSTNTVTFQKFGSGANPVLNITGTSASTDMGIWINGSDYITFNGIDITDMGTTSTNWVEYGVYLNGTASNGCNNNTFKNCKITLSNANSGSNGVYVLSTATSTAGKNSYNKFYNNTIYKASIGYKFTGVTAYYDSKNEVGTDGSGRSVITTIGNATSISNRGIEISYQDSLQFFNTIIDNMKSTASNMIGISLAQAVSNFNFYGDTLSQFTGNEVYGINFNTSPGNNYIHHCLFTEFNSTSGNTNVMRNEGSALGNMNIYDNEIRNITNSGGAVEGMYLNSPTTFNIYNNKIWNLTTTNATGNVEGIALMNASNSTIYNNMIYDCKATISTSSPSVRGIRISAGTIKIYYNTIYFDYTSTNSTNQTAAIFVAAAPTSLDMRNNIFVNNTNVSTGTRAVAFWYTGTNYSSISDATNRNLYYCGVPSSKNLVFYDGTNSDQTLSAYQARMATKDQNSFTENPIFVSNISPYNLHINTTVSTAIEGSGQPITGIDTDIDGNIRYGSSGYTGGSITGTDLGADEFSGVPPIPMTYASSTLTQTNTSYALKNTTNTQIIGFQVVTNGLASPLSLTEFALNTAGTAISGTDFTNAKIFYTGTSPVFVTSVQFGSTVTLPSGAYTINGNQLLSTGTNYFWLTYDIPSTPTNGNIIDATCTSIKIAGVDQIPSLTDPTGSRIILSSLSGTYTIDNTIPTAGTNFNTITEAIAALNTCTLTSAVTFNINQGSTGTYIGNYTITNNISASATNSILIKSFENDSSKVTLTYAATSTTDNFIFKLDGAKYVTIKNLKIQPTGATYSNAILLTNTATNNTIQGNYFVGVLGTGGTADASAYKVLIRNADINSSNNIFVGNYIYRGSVGISLAGSSVTQLTGMQIKNNKIIDFSWYGIDASYTNSLLIDSNTVTSSVNNTSGTRIAINLNNSYDFLRVTKNTLLITGTAYNPNCIYMANNSYPLLGYSLIANNMMSITTGTNYTYALRFNTVSNAKIYNNSIYVNGALASDTRGINFYNGGANNEIKNNNISCNYQPLWIESAACIIACDNNNYYTTNTSNPFKQNNVAYNTLALLQAGSLMDASSLTVNPMYLSTTDLHVDLTNVDLDGKATPLADVTTDIDGTLRNTSSPDIGADEFSPVTEDAGIVEISGLSAPCPNTNVTVRTKLKNFGLNNLTSVSINWQLNGILQSPVQFNGNLATTATSVIDLGQISILPNTTYNVKVWTSSPNGVVDQYNINDTLALNNIFASIAGGTYTIGANNANYPSITEAIADLNTKGICGAVVFDIQPGTYSGQYLINNIAGSSSTNTITFKSENNDSVNVILQYDAVNTTDNYIIKCNGTNYISFKGLTLKTIDATYANIFTLTGTMNNLNILSCIMEGTQTVSTDDNQILIRCNTLNQINGFNLISNKMSYGRMAINYTSTLTSTNIVMKYNNLYNQTTRPMNLSKIEALDFGFNQLYSDASKTSNGGIYTTTLTGQMRFYNNSLINLGGARVWEGWTYGGTTVGHEALVFNNYFYGSSISSYVFDGGGAVNNIKFYNNTFVGNSINRTVNFNNYYGTNSNITFKNNIIHSNGQLIYFTANPTGLYIDYNNYYTTSVASWASFWGTSASSLAAIQSITGQDVNSVSINPQFVSVNDPHIINTDLIATGVYLPEVFVDIDGQSRNNPPTIGAVELIGPASRTLNLKLYLQGLYAGNSLMTPVQDDLGNGIKGSKYSDLIADLINIDIYDTNDVFVPVYSKTNVSISVDGLISLNDINIGLTGTYYIVINHRNSIETWSKPITFSNKLINYNFTTSASKAYGNNLVDVGNGIYAIYGGDNAKDGFVDIFDMIDVENDANNFVENYTLTDITGDGFTDIFDMIIVENNANLFVEIKRP